MTSNLRKIAGLMALQNLAQPTLMLMASAPVDEVAAKYFEVYRSCVLRVLDDFPEIAAKADADQVAKRMIDDAANDRKPDA